MMITGSMGFEFTLKTRKDSLPFFNHPALFMHSSTFNKRMLWFAGLKLDGNICRNYNFMVDLDFISSGWKINLQPPEPEKDLFRK